MKYLAGHSHFFGLVWLFNVDAEGNFPSDFSAILMFFAGLLLLIITILESRRIGHLSWHWVGLSFMFLYLSADEAFSYHEKLIITGPILLREIAPIFNYALTYIIPAMSLLFIIVLFCVKFFLGLPARTRLSFLMASVLFLGGAVGFELISGRYAAFFGMDNLTYNLIATVEESLEMAGTVYFIVSLLKYIADNFREVCFRLDRASNQSQRYPIFEK